MNINPVIFISHDSPVWLLQNRWMKPFIWIIPFNISHHPCHEEHDSPDLDRLKIQPIIDKSYQLWGGKWIIFYLYIHPVYAPQMYLGCWKISIMDYCPIKIHSIYLIIHPIEKNYISRSWSLILYPIIYPIFFKWDYNTIFHQKNPLFVYSMSPITDDNPIIYICIYTHHHDPSFIP